MSQPLELVESFEIMPRIDAAFERLERWLAQDWPRASIEHVGSTAVPGSLTKGDLDVQIRVDSSDFEPLRRALSRRYRENPGGFGGAESRSFEFDDDGLPIGVHLTVRETSNDFQWRIRDTLAHRLDLVGEYNALKRVHRGKPIHGDDYLQAKDAFFSRVMQSQAFARTLAGPSPARVRVHTERFEIRTPLSTDAGPQCEYAARNRTHLERWEPARPRDYFDVSYWRRVIDETRLSRMRRESVAFLISEPGQPKVVGYARFANIVYGAFGACHLGYSVDVDWEGRGVLSEALPRLIDIMFSEWKLHRIMANYMPENTRSGRLLERLGFRIEGTAKDYLCIGGVWRDHVLTALVRRGPSA